MGPVRRLQPLNAGSQKCAAECNKKVINPRSNGDLIPRYRCIIEMVQIDEKM